MKRILCLLLLSFSCSTFASISLDSLKNLEVSVGVGAPWYTADNSNFARTASETDTASVNKVATSALYTMGVGYHFLLPQKYFNDLLLELNLYHVHAAIYGQTLQYGESSQNNYHFQAPLSSTRLMLDFKPEWFTMDHFSPYPILGVGMAWNKLSYNETVSNSDVPAGYYTNYQTGLSRHIAYDAGLGVRYHVTQHLNASLEYLYNRSGTTTSSASLASGVPSVGPVSFSTYAQNLLFNLSWQF